MPHAIDSRRKHASTISLPKGLFAALKRRPTPISFSPLLVEIASASADTVYERLGSGKAGLTADQAADRLAEHGPNVVAADARKSVWTLLWHAFINPLVLLLAALATIAVATGDLRSAVVMSLMIVLGVSIRLIQEANADHAAAKLKAMVSVTAAVMRDGELRELAVSQLVPGDVVKLAAGDMISAEVRIVSARDLFVTQGPLTGELFPVEKFEIDKGTPAKSPLELDNIAFLGTSVESGTALAVVVATAAIPIWAALRKPWPGSRHRPPSIGA